LDHPIYYLFRNLTFLIKKYHLLGMSLYIVNLITIHAIVAIGLNILVGYTGQISMGHAGFFAIGAFTTVILVLNWGFPLYIALPLQGSFHPALDSSWDFQPFD